MVVSERIGDVVGQWIKQTDKCISITGVTNGGACACGHKGGERVQECQGSRLSVYICCRIVLFIIFYTLSSFFFSRTGGREREDTIIRLCLVALKSQQWVYISNTHIFLSCMKKKSRPLWQTFRDKKEDKTCTPIFAVVYLEKYCRVKRIPTVSNKPTEVSLDENHTLLSPARFVASLPFVYLIKGLLYTDLNLADAGLKKPVFWSLKGADGSHILLTLSYLLLESIER